MSIYQLIEPDVKDLGGFVVRRSLPYPGRQLVGPFIFFDHLGPSVLPAGKGIDVRPHPHINLATVTYLFEGVLLHRDSLGTVQEIQPGAVNWMTAGRGVTHSERSPDHDRRADSAIHGIQTWIALPEDHEEDAPWFRHYPAAALPTWQENGATIVLIAGQFHGYTSPVEVFSPMLYLDVLFAPATQIMLPADYCDRAVYSITTGLQLNTHSLPQHQLAILQSGEPVTLAATTAARCIIIGGEPLGIRYKWWNFVSSRIDRIQQAQADWREQRFAPVPQETEFIPLPETVVEANPWT